MAEQFEITAEMREAASVPSEPWRVELTTTAIRAFARGVGYTDPVYFDEGAAKRAGYPALPAPPGYLGVPVFIPGRSDDEASSAPSPLELDFGLSNLLDAGVETTCERQLFAGDVFVATSRVVDLETKASRSLGAMLLVTGERQLRDAENELVATERLQFIRY